MTPEDQKQLVYVLVKMRGNRVLVRTANTVPTSQRLAEELHAAFHDAGWKMKGLEHHRRVGVEGIEGQSGILLFASNNITAQAVQAALAKTLQGSRIERHKDAGLPIDTLIVSIGPYV